MNHQLDAFRYWTFVHKRLKMSEKPEGILPVIIPLSDNSMTWEDIRKFFELLETPTRAEKQDAQPNDPHAL